MLCQGKVENISSASTWKEIVGLWKNKDKEMNSWEICCACARFPLKLEEFPSKKYKRNVRGCCIILNACLIVIIFLLETKTK